MLELNNQKQEQEYRTQRYLTMRRTRIVMQAFTFVFLDLAFFAILYKFLSSWLVILYLILLGALALLLLANIPNLGMQFNALIH